MTARDYLRKQHPEWDSKELERTILLSCPSDHNILDNLTDCPLMNREYSPVDKLPCDTCWNREVTVYVRDRLGPDDVIEPADKTIAELFEEYEMNKEKEKEEMMKEYKESELTCGLDYKAEFEHLQDVVEKQRGEIRELGNTIRTLQHTIDKQHRKIDKYEAVISCVEAFIGQKIDI